MFVAYVITHSGHTAVCSDYDESTGQSIAVHGSPETLPKAALPFLVAFERKPSGTDENGIFFDLAEGGRMWLEHALMQWIALWCPKAEWNVTDMEVAMKSGRTLPFWVAVDNGRVVAFAAPSVIMEQVAASVVSAA